MSIVCHHIRPLAVANCSSHAADISLKKKKLARTPLRQRVVRVCVECSSTQHVTSATRPPPLRFLPFSAQLLPEVLSLRASATPDVQLPCTTTRSSFRTLLSTVLLTAGKIAHRNNDKNHVWVPVRRWLQLRLDFDSTPIRLQFDRTTTI